MTADDRAFAPHRALPRWPLRGLALALGLSLLGGCRAGDPATPVTRVQDAAGASAQPEEARMWMTIGERRFAIALADTAASRAFAAQLPLTLDMAELNGNEKYADLPQALPADASRLGTIRSGDLMLYGSTTVVVFYETFRTPYSYTRLGHVIDPGGLEQALGPRGVRIVFSRD